MLQAPLPRDEDQRLAALRSLQILDTPPEERFDRITRIATRLFDVPIALISLIDANRQWFKSCQGLAVSETPRAISFCGHAIIGDDVFVVPDAHLDPRFSDNPLVTDQPYIRFYAGCPLTGPNGSKLGTLCLVDRRPRQMSDADLKAMKDLAIWAQNELNAVELNQAFAISANLLKMIFETAPECLKLVAADGRLLNMNPAGLAMIEADSLHQVVGQSVYPLVIPENRPAFEKLTEDAFRGKSGRLEYEIVGLKGTRRWLETQVVPFRDGKGGITAALGVTRDVTERKRTEAELRAKTGQLQTITDAMMAFLQSGDWREASATLLRNAVSQTASEYGFVGVVVEGPVLRILAHEGITWNPTVNRAFYENAVKTYREQGFMEFTNFNNLFGKVITSGKVVIANDPAADPRSGGSPPGHPPLRHFLGVPIFKGTEVVGMIGVANRPGGYTGNEQSKIESLTQAAGVLYDSYRRLQREAALKAEHKRAEEGLRRSEAKNLALLNAMPDMMFRIRKDGTYLDFIAAKSADINMAPLVPPDEFLGKNIKEIMPPDVARPAMHYVQQALETGSAQIYEYQLPIRGNVRDYEARIVVSGEDEVLAIVRDITERKAQAAALEYQALHDILTDLPNRTLVQDRLKQAIHAAERENKPVALLLMDLDRFKDVNDALGHHHGDLLLKQVGPRVLSALRESDTIARLGGDEFAVLLPATDIEGAKVAARKILEALDPPFVVEGFFLEIGASIGIAMFPEQGEDADMLMRRADVAMYQAKQSGSGYAVYVSEHDRHSPRRLALMGELRHSIEREEMVLYYQPKIDVKTGRTTGVEALVRWRHPQSGMILPDEFIALAEHTGFIKSLTLWVLNEGLRQHLAWQQAGIEITVAVNLSARNLQDLQLPDQIAGLLQTGGVAPGRLELEITESAIMADPARAMEILTRLRGMGIRFSIDDFGAGYSSLGYLKKLPVDAVKVDKSFVIGMAANADDAVIVRSTIDLAHNLGLKVVAEGVESKAIWDRLVGMGCDAAQGYYMCRPIPADEFTRWLGESPWGLKA